MIGQILFFKMTFDEKQKLKNNMQKTEQHLNHENKNTLIYRQFQHHYKQQAHCLQCLLCVTISIH